MTTKGARMNCPHCQAEVPESSAFCTFCGKAVATGSGGPRIVKDSGLAASLTGQTLQAEELKKQMKKAFGALLFVAILQTLAAFVFPLIALNGAGAGAGGQAKIAAIATGVILGIIAALFYGLAFWARKQPFPAAVTGLSILVTLWAVDAVLDPAGIAKGIIMKVILIGLLVQAIQAGVRHRKLMREMSSAKVMMPS